MRSDVFCLLFPGDGPGDGPENGAGRHHGLKEGAAWCGGLMTGIGARRRKRV